MERGVLYLSLLVVVSRAAPVPEGYGAPPPPAPLPGPLAAAAAAERGLPAAGVLPPAPGLRYSGLGPAGPGLLAGGYGARLGAGGPGLGPGAAGLRGLSRGPAGLGLAAAAASGLGNPLVLRPDGLLAGPGMPYSFDWAVEEPDYGNSYGHREDSDGELVQGEYRTLLPDGRTQVVTYSVLGDSGFQAQVTYDGEARYVSPSEGPAPLLPGAVLDGGAYSRGRPGLAEAVRPFGLAGLGLRGSPFPAVDEPVIDIPDTTYGL